MYIVYDKKRVEAMDRNGYFNYPCVTILPEDSEASEFKPTWLVRVSNWRVVDGKDVKGHYWALSYSWNQSGEIIHEGGEEYRRVDEGRHEIITYNTVETNVKHHKSKNGVLRTTEWKKLDRTTKEKRYGNFEDVIQEICADFHIKYIWFDQLCINQGNHDDKMREIKQMHLIYRNARCTLVLVPELYWDRRDIYKEHGVVNTDVIQRSQWSKRLWTLEEAYMSKSILFVGRNAHFWWDITDYDTGPDKKEFLTHMCQPNKAWRVCTLLWIAAKRTSSKRHDRIFALANIYPELKSGISFNYHQDPIDLAVQFYGLLAQKDISILYFGVPEPYRESVDDAKIREDRQIEAESLPSWTGTKGIHIPNGEITKEFTETSFSYSINEKSMNVKSTYISIHIHPAKPDDYWRYIPEGMDPLEEKPDYMTTQQTIHPVSNSLKKSHGASSMIPYLTFIVDGSSYESYTPIGMGRTHSLLVDEENGSWVNRVSGPYFRTAGDLSLTENCSQCFILSGTYFDFKHYSKASRCYPVVREYDGSYRAIGLCFIDLRFTVEDYIQGPRHFAII
ncbi:hypothetical protein BJV82DRAFT_663565 [Fennellomyces sp. T-0311]|nr:hypothetical protein BJV82DRAFT_663565 [Fennellomyces sp. T-0311]